MVWILPGNLAYESSRSDTYGPQFLLDEDVVMVSFNFRLGPLGFLSLGTPGVSGNQALRDQSLALAWVQDNIHLFGGDKDKVTIFGESTGSWCVFYHLLSPLSAGLFRAAIGKYLLMVMMITMVRGHKGPYKNPVGTQKY